MDFCGIWNWTWDIVDEAFGQPGDQLISRSFYRSGPILVFRMRRHRNTLLKNLSAHGICALVVLFFSQVVPLGSPSEVQPLMDRIYQLISTRNAVEKTGFAWSEKAGLEAKRARVAARDQPARGPSKTRSTVNASGG